MNKRRVLLVDDQPSIRKMMSLALGKDFDLDEAESADQATRLIEKDPPDAVLLDVMMPGSMNGFQLCERIKSDPETRAMIVVLVSACGQVADQEMGRDMGADAYYIKPFSPLELARHLKQLLAMEGRT
jgi:two-component system phosphate regulon response regulator PhoB